MALLENIAVRVGQGAAPGDINDVIEHLRDMIEQAFGRSISIGECVIERDLEAQQSDRTIWKGRAKLYPDVTPELGLYVRP
jgi:hypothetical protein